MDSGVSVLLAGEVAADSSMFGDGVGGGVVVGGELDEAAVNMVLFFLL